MVDWLSFIINHTHQLFWWEFLHRMRLGCWFMTFFIQNYFSCFIENYLKHNHCQTVSLYLVKLCPGRQSGCRPLSHSFTSQIFSPAENKKFCEIILSWKAGVAMLCNQSIIETSSWTSVTTTSISHPFFQTNNFSELQPNNFLTKTFLIVKFR